VAGLVGAAPVTLEPRLEVTDADRAEAMAVLAGDDRPLVILHPGANDPRRRWPVERLAVAGNELARKGARLAVVGTATEQPLVDRLLDRLDGHAADLDTPRGGGLQVVSTASRAHRTQAVREVVIRRTALTGHDRFSSCLSAALRQPGTRRAQAVGSCRSSSTSFRISASG
jgi:hypothetical protein